MSSAFGIDELAKVMLIVMGVTPTVILDTVNLVRAVPQEQTVKAFTLGASDFDVAYRVVLKQVMPRVLNSIRLSEITLEAHLKILDRFRPEFLKGMPSVLYWFAYYAGQSRLRRLGFRAVFSTGETLLLSHRDVIESNFGCKVFDSYGHMERTVAVSECPEGGMHINPEYGVMELCRENADCDAGGAQPH